MANFEHEDGPVIDVFDPRCPSRSILRDVTGRWAPLVLMALNDGACRFGELHRTIGGSNERMLSQTLATLTDDKLISRSLGRKWPTFIRAHGQWQKHHARASRAA